MLRQCFCARPVPRLSAHKQVVLACHTLLCPMLTSHRPLPLPDSSHLSDAHASHSHLKHGQQQVCVVCPRVLTLEPEEPDKEGSAVDMCSP